MYRPVSAGMRGRGARETHTQSGRQTDRQTDLTEAEPQDRGGEVVTGKGGHRGDCRLKQLPSGRFAQQQQMAVG